MELGEFSDLAGRSRMGGNGKYEMAFVLMRRKHDQAFRGRTLGAEKQGEHSNENG